MTEIGIHAGLQRTTFDELRSVWEWADEVGLAAVTVCDHVYSSETGGFQCFDGSSVLGALASSTRRARIGCLVFSTWRHNALLLAKTAVTVDHISHGRFELGLGAGWEPREHGAVGAPMASAPERVARLEDSAHRIRALLRVGQVQTVDGPLHCEPRPVQPALPIWIGGTRRRVLEVAARLGDGWNAAGIGVEAFRSRRRTLAQLVAANGRELGSVRCSVNSALSTGATASKFGAVAGAVESGLLGGSVAEVVDSIGRFAAAGADRINVVLRAPWDPLERDLIADAAAELRHTVTAPEEMHVSAT